MTAHEGAEPKLGRPGRPLRPAIATSLTLFATACSGGGGGGAGREITPSTGVLGSRPIVGVRYISPTQSGVTDEEGQFLYLEGETVQFHLGATRLGEHPGSARVTLFDLSGRNRSEPPVQVADDSFGTLDILMNSAVFLQSLDQDGEPSNGIRISAAVAELAEGHQIELDEPFTRFRRHRPFRALLNAANDGQLFDSHRAPQAPALALNSLYESDPLFFALIVHEEDDDADGAPDSMTQNEYDSAGFLVRRVRDSDIGESLSRRVETREIGPRGELERVAVDQDDDGVPDIEFVYQHDQNAEMVGYQEIDGSGVPVFALEVELNEFGDEVLERHDFAADGTIDRVIAREFDERGNKIRRSTDVDADGTEDSIDTFTYDENDHLLLEERDTDGDGSPDQIRNFVYDAEGRLLILRADMDADGTEDFVKSIEYDAEGRIVLQVQDTNADGLPDSTLSFEYDSRGNRVRVEADLDGDLLPDEIDLLEYDAFDRLIRSEHHSGGDANPERVELTSRDEHGNPIRIETLGPDGNSIEILTNAYGRFGWGARIGPF